MMSRLSFLLSVALCVGVGHASPEGAQTGDSLVDIVPADTLSVWSWRPSEETRLLEEHLLHVVDAVLEARFDEFAFDVMGMVGASEELVKELRAARNMVVGVAGMIPWRELAQGEIVYAEGKSGRLLACRPGADQLKAVERSISGLLGSLAGMMIVPIRYDIDVDDATGTTTYRLTLRSREESALLQIAINKGTILIGMGQDYVAAARALLEGGDVPRLSDSPRFVKAFGDLPENAAGRTYVDMSLLADDLDELAALVGKREFNAGFLQSLLNDGLGLVGSVDTMTTSTRCVGDRVIVETLTRFDPESSSNVRAGLAVPASETLLAHVPADVVSFDMRGNVNAQPVFQWARERWQADWAPAQDLLWVFDIFEAAMGLSFERDFLSWFGSEKVSVNMPARRSAMPGAMDSVTICMVRDPKGVRKCLERVEGLFNATAPRLIKKLQEVIRANGLPFFINVQLTPGKDPFPELRKLRITAIPMQVPPIVYGMVGDLFVFATSQEALEHCFAVAAGEKEGLSERELVSGLAGRGDLCSARMQPAGQAVADLAGMLGMIGGWMQFAKGMVESNAPEAIAPIDTVIALLSKVSNILGTIDFLGDEVTTSEYREDGLARYEITTLQLLAPAKDLAASEASPERSKKDS